MKSKDTDKALMILVALQIALPCVVRFVDIGFDHPSRWGLDFDSLLAIGFIYLIFLLAGLGLTAFQRDWKGYWGQLLIPVVLIVLSAVFS